MARSLAFWFVEPKPENQSNAGVELHFNYWRLQSGMINYLDVGVRLISIASFSSIKFYFPFDEEDMQYEPDLGEKVCSSFDLVSAVFNDSVTKLEKNENRHYYDVTFGKQDTNPPIRFFTNLLPEEKKSKGGVVITPENSDKSKGTIIEFPSNMFELITEIDGYFRFRLKLSNNAMKSLSRTYNPKGALITNYFETHEIVDFRVNESRNLPTKIKENLTNNSYIKKVHFFLIRDAKSEYRMSHDVYDRCRILEANIWNDYLGISIDDSVDNQMLIYHWKGKVVNNFIEHFSAFAKFTRRVLKIKHLLLISLFIIILGVLSGLIANWIWPFVQEYVQLKKDESSGQVASTVMLPDGNQVVAFRKTNLISMCYQEKPATANLLIHKFEGDIKK